MTDPTVSNPQKRRAAILLAATYGWLSFTLVAWGVTVILAHRAPTANGWLWLAVFDPATVAREWYAERYIGAGLATLPFAAAGVVATVLSVVTTYVASVTKTVGMGVPLAAVLAGLIALFFAGFQVFVFMVWSIQLDIGGML